MSTVTLSSKYQVSIPKDIREALNLRPGQKLVFLQTGTAIKLVPQPTVDELIGLFRGADTEGYRDRGDRAADAPAPKARRSGPSRSSRPSGPSGR